MKTFALFAVVGIAVIMTSCTSETPTTTEKMAKGINLKDYGIGAVDTVQALLIYHAGDYVEDYSTIFSNANVQALTFNEDSLVDVSSVTVNSDILTRISEGIYSASTPTIPSGGSTALAWAINGYRGGNFSNTFSMAPRLTVTNLAYGDTIDMSVGKTITYSGSNGGELVVNAVFGETLSGLLIHPDSTTIGGDLSKTATDNGSLLLSSGDLSGLTPHRIYVLTITHAAYTSQPYAGTKVGHHSSYSYTVPFVLVP